MEAANRPRIIKHFSSSDAQAPAGSNLNQGSSYYQHNSQIRLPPIDFPNLDDSFKQLRLFNDTFDSLVHTNNEITDAQKVHYLKS